MTDEPVVEITERFVEELRRSLWRHECAGPVTLFRDCNGNAMLKEQCVACQRRLKQWPYGTARYGLGLETPWDERRDPKISEVVRGFKRLLVYNAMLRGEDIAPWHIPALGQTDPLVVFFGHLRRDRYRERFEKPDWRALRQRVIARGGGRCEACGARGALDVHHLHYRTFGREGLDDLMALCIECHRNGTHGAWEGTNNAAQFVSASGAAE